MAIFWSLPRADDNGVLGVHDEPFSPLGSQYHDAETGYVWQYLKAFEDLAFGDVVAPELNLHDITNLDTAAPAGSTEINSTTENFLTGLVRIKPKSKQKEMGLIQVFGGAGAGQRGVITEIYTNRLVIEWLTKDGTLTTALDNTSDLEIAAPWLAHKASDVGSATTGFVQQLDGVKRDQYFWALYCGTGTVRAGVATPRGSSLDVDATNGRVAPIGGTEAASFKVGISLFPAADGEHVLANLKANLLIGEVPVRTDLGYVASTVSPPATGSA